MSGAHTPGPWEVFHESRLDGGTRIFVRTAAFGWSAMVCRVTPIGEGSAMRWADEDMSDETRAANAADARLIASAPDLLAALIHIQQVACSESPELAIATEAIAKATGETA